MLKSTKSSFGIVEVWKDNLDEAIEQMQKIVQDYPYIAIDTEFPGVVIKPTQSFQNKFMYHYATLQQNVNVLKIIQLGLTFFNERGERPFPSTFEINFHFNIHEDRHAPESIQLLLKSGIDFDQHSKRGVLSKDFAERIMMSGIVLNDNVRWIAFHGNYDFGYFCKILINSYLPESYENFFCFLQYFFPRIYDLKVIMGNLEHFYGGLHKLQQRLQVKSHLPQHQAGSDSFVTGQCFFQMRYEYLEEQIESSKCGGILYGLDSWNRNWNYAKPVCGPSHSNFYPYNIYVNYFSNFA